MSQVITNAFEQYWQSSLAAEQPVVLDEFVLADIPNLDITSPINPDTGLPPAGQIVYRQDVDQRGRVNNNAVAYSIVMDTAIGDFSFNAMYLRNKANGVVGMIVYKGRETKLKTNLPTAQTGNSLVKSMLMGYDQAAEATLTQVDAGTWQIDYAARLRGQDEDLRQLASQLYGHHTFIGDGFKVVEQAGAYQVTQGVAVVGGLRIELQQPEVIYPGSKPIGVWVDVYRSGSLLSEHQNHFTLITSVADLTDHVDGNGYQHYVAKLAMIAADSTILDARLLAKSVSVMDFGAVGDGITDDAPAFQAAIDYVLNNEPTSAINLQGKVDLTIPAGQFRIKTLVAHEEVTSRRINLRLHGAGIYQTSIIVDKDNHAGFLSVGVLGGNEAVFHVSDMAILAEGQGNGTALRLYADPVGLSRNRRVIIENVSVRPIDADGQWFNRGIVANGLYYGLVRNCSTSGPFGSTVSATSFQDDSPAYFMDVGFDLKDCYDPTVEHCFAWSTKVGYDLSNTIDPGSEGGLMLHSGSSRVLTGLRRKTVGREPGFIVAFCHFNYRDFGMDLENLKDVDIVSTMIYNENSGMVGTGAAARDMRFSGCQDVTISKCRLQFDGDPRRISIDIKNSFDNANPGSRHRAINFYIDGNDFASSYFANLVRTDSVDPEDAAIERIVLRSFNNNTWKESAVGTTITQLLNLSPGTLPKCWLSVQNGVFRFRKVSGDDVVSIDANGRLKITVGGSGLGEAVDVGARDMVVDTSSANAGISLMSTGFGRIYAGRVGAPSAGGLSYEHAADRWTVRAASASRAHVTTAAIGPASDNNMTAGTATLRYSTVYAGTGAINTSDEREKTELLPIDDAVLDVWASMQFGVFQWVESIRLKGKDVARWHFGLIAQQVRDAFTTAGLDGTRYGLLCYDEWEDEFEPVIDFRHNPETNEFEPYDTGDEQLSTAAGNRWGIRPDQCLFLEAALQRRNYHTLSARVEALEGK